MSASSLFPGVESVGHLALPLWIAGALAAFFLVVCVIALNSDGPTRAMRILVASILVVSGALVSLVLIQGQGAGLAAQRSLVTARVLDLNTGATAQAHSSTGKCTTTAARASCSPARAGACAAQGHHCASRGCK